MKSRTLQDWLSWQETLNPKEIDLGLDRVGAVLGALGWPSHFDCPLVTVAGTNGKGSVVAFAESIARASGLKTASYTSPHLLRYNERIRLDGRDIGDAALIAAFERIDAARGEIPLTYFEFGTLAAIDIFQRSQPGLVVMEVGLGGRLDAVNVMDADVAVITMIDIDHVDWLGTDRESIGREKSGIFRAGRPVVCEDPSPPRSLLEHASDLGCTLWRYGRDFAAERADGGWNCRLGSRVLGPLELPALNGDFQLHNAAAAVQALDCLGIVPGIDAIGDGLTRVRLQGRFQRVARRPAVIVDVAHNPQSAAALRDQLRADRVEGKTLAVVAMLADKAVAEVIALLADDVDEWHCAGLDTLARGMKAGVMAQTVRCAVEREGADVKLCPASTVSQACAEALEAARPEDRVVVFGSFHTVSEALEYFGQAPGGALSA